MDDQAALILNARRYLTCIGVTVKGERPRTPLGKARKDVKHSITRLMSANFSTNQISAMAETTCQRVVIDMVLERV